MSNNPQAVLRVCKQIDFATESYYARGPVTRVGEICRFTQSQIEPLSGEPSSTLKYMARNLEACPTHESPQYVVAHNITEADFSVLNKFLDELASSRQALDNALADLPSDRQSYADLADVRAQVARSGRLPIVRVVEFPGFLNLWSVFEVDVKSTTDDAFYVLRVRRLFGSLSVIGLAKANS